MCGVMRGVWSELECRVPAELECRVNAYAGWVCMLRTHDGGPCPVRVTRSCAIMMMG
jgi:hypothetical protein